MQKYTYRCDGYEAWMMSGQKEPDDGQEFYLSDDFDPLLKAVRELLAAHNDVAQYNAIEALRALVGKE